jgi:predicted nucleic acid-binding protein
VAGFLPDTSCIVAAVCSWHEHHEAARQEIERRLDTAEPMLAAGPCLVETYAVLTRLPPPYRLRDEDALELINDNFLRRSRLIALDALSYAKLLRTAPAARVRGGRIYDALILACAVKAGASVLLTFNSAHFVDLAPSRITVVVPSWSAGS